MSTARPLNNTSTPPALPTVKLTSFCAWILRLFCALRTPWLTYFPSAIIESHEASRAKTSSRIGADDCAGLPTIAFPDSSEAAAELEFESGAGFSGGPLLAAARGAASELCPAAGLTDGGDNDDGCAAETCCEPLGAGS